MNLNELPNELLAQVVSNLSFKDFISLALTNKRLQKIVRKFCVESNREIEVWRCGRKPKTDLRESDVFIYRDLLIAASSSSTDVYEYSNLSYHFYRTISCSELTLVDKNGMVELFCLIPGTKLLVLLQSRSFFIYDLSRRQVVFDGRQHSLPNLPGTPIAVTCSRRALAITVQAVDCQLTTLYAWNGALASLLRVFQLTGRTFAVLPVMSENGVLVFRPNDERLLRIHHAHQNAGMGEITPDVEFDRLILSENGTRLVLMESSSGLHAIYDVDFKTKIFQMADSSVTRWWFSADIRFLLLHRHGDKRAHVLHLTEDGDGQLLVRHTSDVEFETRYVAIFRNIHNQPHLQIVDDSPSLNVYRLSLTKKTKVETAKERQKKRRCVLM